MFKNVDQKEIAHRHEQILEALEDIEAGRIIDGEEVMNWLSSWGSGEEQEQPEGRKQKKRGVISDKLTGHK